MRSTGNNIKYIVYHYTGNDGDKSTSNGNYFKNHIVKASAHYFVDDNTVTISVPENYIAWHCGGKKYNNCATTGGGTYHGKCTNTNSIGIELCDTQRNGRYNFSDATLENAIILGKDIITRYTVDR